MKRINWGIQRIKGFQSIANILKASKVGDIYKLAVSLKDDHRQFDE